MNQNIIVFLTSFLFGAGLEISQMNNPNKVYGFLNLTREWDPSLAFVMIGAIALTSSAFHWIKIKRIKRGLPPIMGTKFMLPIRQDIDWRLLSGGAIFGIGWGLGGFCPGPAVSGLFRNQSELYIVALSMFVGMFIYALVDKFILSNETNAC